MKRMRESFEENYQPVEEPCNHKRGFRIRYEYIGPWYRWDLKPESLRAEKRILGYACAVSLLFFLAGSLQYSVLNYSSAAGLKYALRSA